MPSLKSAPFRGRAAADPIGGVVGPASGRFVRVVAGLIAASTLALVCWAVPAEAFTLPVTGPSNAPRMVFNNKMTVASVCLPVTNPAGGQSLLYGQRFTDGRHELARRPRSCSCTGSRPRPRTGTSHRPGRSHGRSPAPATSSSPTTGSGTPRAVTTPARRRVHAHHPGAPRDAPRRRRRREDRRLHGRPRAVTARARPRPPTRRTARS